MGVFVCLYGGFTSHCKFFYRYGDVNITGEGLQILTYIKLIAIEQ